MAGLANAVVRAIEQTHRLVKGSKVNHIGGQNSSFALFKVKASITDLTGIH
jgi:hypothetical protein